MAPKPTVASLLHRLEQLDEKRDDSSRRLHVELDEIKRKLEMQGATQLASDARLTRLDVQPIELDKIRVTPRVVVTVVAACLSIFGGIYASTYGLRSDVRDILTTMESQKQLEVVNQRLANLQSEALTKAVDAIDKRQQLQQIQIQELKEMVLKQGVKP